MLAPRSGGGVSSTASARFDGIRVSILAPSAIRGGSGNAPLHDGVPMSVFRGWPLYAAPLSR
jgi:hypothetical protein